MLSDVSPPDRPLWIVCEDGTEYLERFSRFLDGEFRFVAAADAGALVALLDGDETRAAAGVILDLDFRRTASERLIDETGVTQTALSDDRRRRLAATQGILILRHLRARDHALPVLLCADLDDAGQASYLEETLAPLSIVPSHEGLVQTAARMRTV